MFSEILKEMGQILGKLSGHAGQLLQGIGKVFDGKVWLTDL